MRLYRRMKNYLNNSEIDDRERLFMLLAGVALVGLVLALITGILIGENYESLLFCAIGAVVFSALTWFGFHFKKVVISSYIAAFILVFVFMPLNFFSSGAIHGGAVIWNIFDLMYISLILRGKARMVFLICDFVVTGVVYWLYVKFPELTIPHTDETAYQDSLFSLIIVSVFLVIMVAFQTYLYRKENERAREQKDEIDELNRAQNRFFSSMSHEIRTPINTIIGFNEMILREDVSEEINEDATNIESASKMLLHLINDILDMSKLQSGQMELSLSPYNLDGMLMDVAGMIWIRAKEKGLTFTVDASPTVPADLTGDEMRIKQILINVLNNAVKYTKRGSVTLTVRHEEREEGEINLIFTVTDTGMGIRKESIPYLFDAFRRVDEDRTSMIEGTGLGLSIVKQFVDLMDGQITVDSVYTKGSIFTVVIPQHVIADRKLGDLNQGKKEVTRHSDYKVSFVAPEAKVLVVDDTSTNLIVVKKLLRDTKVQITTAPGGNEALELTMENQYDVIFMDHKMPGMDGIECFHRIRNQIGGQSRDAKVAALTANAGSEIAALYEREGFDSYLVKPVSGMALEKELLRLLPQKLVTLMDNNKDIEEKSRLWREDHQVRASVAIVSHSMLDVPSEMLKEHRIGVVPVNVVTEQGVFRDMTDISTTGLLSYIEDENKSVRIESVTGEQYVEFFAEHLRKAQNVFYISMTRKVANSSLTAAEEVAKSFDHVTLFDSCHVSSGQGMIVLEASRLAESGASPEEITAALEEMIPKVNTSFIIDDMQYLSKAQNVSIRFVNLTKAFMFRPVLHMKNGKMALERIYFGSRKRAWLRYIKHTLRKKSTIDTEQLFITYIGLPPKELEWIRERVERIVSFKEVYLQEASPAMAINCGPGTFGLLFKRK